MGIFKKLSGLFAPQEDKEAYWIEARCRRCGEVVRSRVNLYNDLSVEYTDRGTEYLCHKTLMGEGRCFQRLDVDLVFDDKRRLIERRITGGEFVDGD